MNTLHVKKGDTVVVITGKDKGKKGEIKEVYPKLGKVLIEGVHVVKRSMRAMRENSKGQIVEKSLPIDASNVRLAEKVAKAPKAKKTAKKKTA